MAVDSPHTLNGSELLLWEKLVQLGANENTASVLICLHHHGAASSKDLQCHCNIRQPDVSLAISELRDMNLVHFSSRSESSRGRPAHIYRLRMSLEQSIKPFVNRAKKRANEILNDVESIRELVGQVETTQHQAFTAA
jgi:predicted transcriptional regulator